MSVRETYYKAYGMTDEEARIIKKYCQSADFDKMDLLVACAEDTNIEIAEQLVESIRNGWSYEILCGHNYVYYGKNDFYGYQRQCIAKFRNAMLVSPDYRAWEQMTIFDFIH